MALRSGCGDAAVGDGGEQWPARCFGPLEEDMVAQGGLVAERRRSFCFSSFFCGEGKFVIRLHS